MSRGAALFLVLGLAAAFALSLALPLAPLLDVWSEDAGLGRAILLELRLPRALLALIYGAMLGMAGAAVQALFANPLASPDLTGTTSGAALGAVLTAYILGFSAPLALSIGSVLGALLIGVVNNGLILMGLETPQQVIIRGAIIVVAVALARRS